MRTHRIHSCQTLEPGQDLSLDGPQAHYLSRVLRVAPGYGVVLFNGDGHDYPSEVVRVGSKSVELRVVDRAAARRESWLRVTVVQALSRGERFDTTLQKCTELGAAAFQPLITERTEVRVRAEKLPRRLAHWQSVVVSACEQSGRAIVPEVMQPLELTDWLSRPATGMRLVLDPGSGTSLASIEAGNRLDVVIGPEGGFSDGEAQLMRDGGVRGVSLGPRVLRTETAGPAALAVLQATSGDLA